MICLFDECFVDDGVLFVGLVEMGVVMWYGMCLVWVLFVFVFYCELVGVVVEVGVV